MIHDEVNEILARHAGDVVGSGADVNPTERGYRAGEAAKGKTMWADVPLSWTTVTAFRLCLARLGGDPLHDRSREELKCAVDEALAELRGAVAAVGWDAGVAVWAGMEPETRDAVMGQFAYLRAIEERDAA